MKRKEIKKWLYSGWLLICFVGIFAACGQENSKNEKLNEERAEESSLDEELVKVGPGNCITGQGILFYDDILHFYDFQTKTFYPLCGRPNCTHKDEECTAVRLRQTFFVAIYKDSLYYVRYVEEQGVNCFCKAEISGEGETVIAEVPEYGMLGGSGVLFYGDKAYLMGTRFEYEDPEEDGTEETVWQIVSLLSMNLQSGEIKPIMEMTLGDNSSAIWAIEHIYDGKLYFCFDSSETETEYEPGWYTCDLKSGELKCLGISEELEVSAWDENIAICQELSVDPESSSNYEELTTEKHCFRWNLDTGELEELYTFHLSGPHVLLENGYAHGEWKEGYREGSWSFYRWDTGEDRVIGMFTDSQSFFPIAVYQSGEDYEIVGDGTREDENGRIIDCHAVISVEEFLNGGTGYRFLE